MHIPLDADYDDDEMVRMHVVWCAFSWRSSSDGPRIASVVYH